MRNEVQTGQDICIVCVDMLSQFFYE